VGHECGLIPKQYVYPVHIAIPFAFRTLTSCRAFRTWSPFPNTRGYHEYRFSTVTLRTLSCPLALRADCFSVEVALQKIPSSHFLSPRRLPESSSAGQNPLLPSPPIQRFPNSEDKLKKYPCLNLFSSWSEIG